MGFIDKALEKARAARKPEEKLKPSAGMAKSPATSPPPTEARITEQLMVPQEISYNITRKVSVDPEVLRRNRIIAGGWEAGSGVIEGYEVLRTHVLHRTAEEGRNTIMVAGSLAGEGKTLTAINLAIILSQELNNTVLLVDADLRSPSITHYFGLGNEPGIVDYLTAGVPLSELLIHPQGIGKLVILPAGRPVPQTSELLNSPAMRDLVQELKHFYANRYVIFDLPPLLLYADALAFAPLVDSILLVVEADRTTRENIQRCQEMLKPFKLLGLVLNKAAGTADHQGYYYSQKSETTGKRKLPVFK